MATIAQATQSKRRHDLGADHAVGQRLAPETGYPSTMAKNTLRRQPPKVGAVCGKAARTVLCGGRSVMGVPTAIVATLLAKTTNTASFYWLHFRSGSQDEILIPHGDERGNAARLEPRGHQTYHLNSRVNARGGWPNSSFTEAASSWSMPSKSSAWMPRVTNRQSIPKPWAPARSVRTESPIARTRLSGIACPLRSAASCMARS